MAKNTGKSQGILSVRKSGNPVISFQPFIPPAKEVVGRHFIVCLSVCFVCHSVDGDLGTGLQPHPGHSVQVKVPSSSRCKGPSSPGHIQTCSL